MNDLTKNMQHGSYIIYFYNFFLYIFINIYHTMKKLTRKQLKKSIRNKERVAKLKAVNKK